MLTNRAAAATKLPAHNRCTRNTALCNFTAARVLACHPRTSQGGSSACIQCRVVGNSPAAGSGGDSGQPPKDQKPTAEDSSGGQGDSSSSSSSSTQQRTWPKWYTVWIWATAAVYLVWRFKWRRDRRLAAEQFALEQRQEEELKQEWYSFARSYGVQTPPPPNSSS